MEENMAKTHKFNLIKFLCRLVGRKNFILSVMRSKNRQIKAIKEIAAAQESMNVILSAYVAILADRRGSVTIPKSEVAAALGKYRVCAYSEGDNYVIYVEGNGDVGDKEQI